MKHRIITISREFGSGGRTIGKKVAEALGISCYDNELIQKIAAESGFNENYILDTGEDAPGGFLASAFSHRASGSNNADYLWRVQFSGFAARLHPCGFRCSGKAHCHGLWRARRIAGAAS